eukprot:658909-Rhodomonas_salina.5
MPVCQRSCYHYPNLRLCSGTDFNYAATTLVLPSTKLRYDSGTEIHEATTTLVLISTMLLPGPMYALLCRRLYVLYQPCPGTVPATLLGINRGTDIGDLYQSCHGTLPVPSNRRFVLSMPWTYRSSVLEINVGTTKLSTMLYLQVNAHYTSPGIPYDQDLCGWSCDDGCVAQFRFAMSGTDQSWIRL